MWLALTVAGALCWVAVLSEWYCLSVERSARDKVVQQIASGPALTVTADRCCPHCGADLRQSGGSGSDSGAGKYATAEQLQALQ